MALLGVIITALLQLAFALTILTLVYVVAKNVLFRKQQPSNARANRAAIVPNVLKVLPLHRSHGWVLDRVHQLRVFQRPFPALDSQPLLASHVLVDTDPKSALEVAVECAEVSNWMLGAAGAASSVQPVTSADPAAGVQLSDVVSVTFSSRRDGGLQDTWRRVVTQALAYVPRLEKFVSAPLDFRIVQFERTWESVNSGSTWYLFCEPRKPSPFSYRWSMLVLSSIPSKEGISLATLVVAPGASPSIAGEEVSSQLHSLKEHLHLRKYKTLSMQPPLPSQQKRTSRPPKAKKAQEDISSTRRFSSQDATAGSLATSPGPKRDQKATLPPPAAPSRTPLLRSNSASDSTHLTLVGRVCTDMLAMAKATESDGWVSDGVVNNVSVMRKPPGPGEPPLTCIKGTGVLQVPPEFVMVVLTNDQYAVQLDDMLKELRIVKEVIPKTVGILHLMYKAVWPTSGRDFVLVNFQGRVDSQTIIQGGTSVVDPSVPEEKGYVRGDCLVGGYVIKAIEDNPNACEVTYIGKLDLKGNIPTFVVNKAMASQPQCVNRLKSIVEPLFARAKRDAELMKTLTDSVKINSLFGDEPVGSSVDSQEKGEQESSEAVGMAKPDPDVSQTFDGTEAEQERVFTPTNLSSSDGEEERNTIGTFCIDNQSYRQLPQYLADDYEGSVPEAFTEESIVYPKTFNGIDYKTLGNQIAAKVIEETFHVSSLDPLDASTFCDQTGGWQYIGMEKGVCILQRKSADSPHYCYMGKAVVFLQPDYVYSCLKNPQLRHSYDNMLKELHIVKVIDTGLYILHMHHETTQCFLKQSRDFCLLVAERSELKKKLLVGSSIEIPECPPNPSITRGKVLCSGWVVEPRTLKTGAVATEITYLLQVDFGGPVPTYILNIISQRQPLAVAYLRDYLMSNMPPAWPTQSV